MARAHHLLAIAEIDKWVAAAAKDLQANRAGGIVVAGDQQPPAVHALAHAMNAALGNAGATVVYTDPVQAAPVDQMQSLRELVKDMNDGRVDLLVILGGNPVYTAPADLKFGDALKKVATRIHLGLYDDETSAMCHWHIPETHFLEAWSDARAFDGTSSIVQPLIMPLYRGARRTRWSGSSPRGRSARHMTCCATTGRRSRRPRVRTSRSSGAARCTTG